jgi:hypothetical protein
MALFCAFGMNDANKLRFAGLLNEASFLDSHCVQPANAHWKGHPFRYRKSEGFGNGPRTTNVVWYVTLFPEVSELNIWDLSGDPVYCDILEIFLKRVDVAVIVTLSSAFDSGDLSAAVGDGIQLWDGRPKLAL